MGPEAGANPSPSNQLTGRPRPDSSLSTLFSVSQQKKKRQLVLEKKNNSLSSLWLVKVRYFPFLITDVLLSSDKGERAGCCEEKKNRETSNGLCPCSIRIDRGEECTFMARTNVREVGGCTRLSLSLSDQLSLISSLPKKKFNQ